MNKKFIQFLCSSLLLLIVHFIPIRKLIRIKFSFALYLLFLLIVHCTLNIEHCLCQWYQITLPVSGGVYQIQFINSNTGWINTEQTNSLTLLRTTNAGINWQIIYSDSAKVITFQFINDTLGFAMGTQSGHLLLLKSTNSGYNWAVMQNNGALSGGGFYMVSADTGWVNSFSVPSHYTFRTTNGFQSIENINNGAGGVPATLHFFKEKYNGEYCGYMSGDGLLWKTTNSGFNWTQINPSGTLYGFSFINKDTGWINIGYQPGKIYNTTNGGNNWILQFYDSIGNYQPISVFALNRTCIWSGLSNANHYILASTNRGITWGKQTSSIIFNYGVYLFDTSLGFAWNDYQIVRTTNGGGPISNVINNNEQIVKNYRLYQNFPNPFNSVTIIRFQIKDLKFVKLKIYNILGKEVATLVNEKLSRGVYEIKWNASGFPSGIYFYSLYINDKKTDTKKTLLIK